MKYKRVLLKLSGEALMGNQQYGIDPQRLDDYAEEIANAVREGAQIAIVIGGGNIFRGLQGASKGIDRVQGDSMGMLATVINSIAIQSTLQAKGIKTVLLSGLYIDKIAETMSGPKAIEYLENGYVVVIGG
ncbi:MAG: UMP kinase, partial [Bacteroidales bacterium]|nr:UMP kinase [Bacteroidales bacterium]